MRNIVKRITTIFLMITLAVLSLQEFCYADTGSSGDVTTYHGKGNVSYPNMVGFPLYHIIVCNGDNAVLVDEYIASNLVQTNGSSTVMTVADGENRTMLWDGTRQININEVVSSTTGKNIIYSSSFESFTATPKLISGLGWDKVKPEAFKSWSVLGINVTTKFLQLMKDIDAYSKCGVPEGSSTMEIAPGSDGAPTSISVDNFEAWLRGYDFNTQQIDLNTTLE